ncbi:hypothetical protein BDZ89DRAFT_1167996 [Hymenopellis radicata]|nr:hypothetical protein BDZ89DRAFT_1167996 [Hymenopellis radicata]
MSTIAEQLGLSEEAVQRLIGDYLNAHILAVFAYALYIMIFGATMRLMVQRGQWSPRRITLTVILCLIWAFATVSFGVAWNAMYATYVRTVKLRTPSSDAWNRELHLAEAFP